MTIRIEQGKDIFELNPGLGKLFPNLTSEEMEYVVYVADAYSIFRMKTEAERRLLSLQLVDGYWYAGKATAKGHKLLDRKNKDVEEAIVKYHKEINNNKSDKIRKTLETLNKYYDSVLDFMVSKEAGDVDEQVKVFNANAKAIKDETIKNTYEQIVFFEKELLHEYDIPEIAAEHTKEKEEISTNSADWIDPDTL